MDYENVLLVKNEVFVYRIPPRQSNRGYRAADWGLDSPFWTGRLRVVAKGKDLNIVLEDRNTGELFAKCPVDAFPGIAVEAVLDSSRYFVIRLMDDNGRTMFTGVGFTERSDSFDFNVAIQDHFKWLKQEKEVEEAEKRSSTEPALDLGFKQGERIKLNLNTKRSGDEGEKKPSSKPQVRLGSTNTGQSNTTSSGGLLPPPPPPAPSRSRGSRGSGAGIMLNQSTNSPTHVPVSNTKLPAETVGNCSTKPSDKPSNVDLLADLLGSTEPF